MNSHHINSPPKIRNKSNLTSEWRILSVYLTIICWKVSKISTRWSMGVLMYSNLFGSLSTRSNIFPRKLPFWLLDSQNSLQLSVEGLIEFYITSSPILFVRYSISHSASLRRWGRENRAAREVDSLCGKRRREEELSEGTTSDNGSEWWDL